MPNAATLIKVLDKSPSETEGLFFSEYYHYHWIKHGTIIKKWEMEILFSPCACACACPSPSSISPPPSSSSSYSLAAILSAVDNQHYNFTEILWSYAGQDYGGKNSRIKAPQLKNNFTGETGALRNVFSKDSNSCNMEEGGSLVFQTFLSL